MKKVLRVIVGILALTFFSIGTSVSVEISQFTITEDQSVADIFQRYTVTGIRTPLPQSPDVPGFVGVSYLNGGDIDEDGIKEIVAASGPGADSEPVTPDGAIALFTSTGPDEQGNRWYGGMSHEDYDKIRRGVFVARLYDDDEYGGREENLFQWKRSMR